MRCDVFGAALGFKKIDPKKIKFVDIEFIFKEAFKKLTPKHNPLSNKILDIKLDHLRYCYFSLSDLARMHENVFFYIKYDLKPFFKDAVIKLRVRAFLSKVKKYFLKS